MEERETGFVAREVRLKTQRGRLTTGQTMEGIEVTSRVKFALQANGRRIEVRIGIVIYMSVWVAL